MNVFYEEDGAFKAGAVLADNGTSLQIEAPHGKRAKIKGAAVLLRFEHPPLNDFLGCAQQVADGLDADFLWQCCGTEEFSFDALAQDYFGHPPSAPEAAGLLLRLHASPVYFYKKGRGRYRAAPQEALQAALAGIEKRRLQAEQQARYVEQLEQRRLPPEFAPLLAPLLYRPDKNSIAWKALDAACAAARLTPAKLLEQCGALPSAHDYHLNRFLFDHFPQGADFGAVPQAAVPPDLPLADVAAFSIDDAATTEIDDAFSVSRLASGWRIGIHIAAPALGFAAGSAIDRLARARLSTVYMPGNKITMLPDPVIHAFTLGEARVCPALSLYLEVDESCAVLAAQSRIERIGIAANLRHDALEEHFNEYALEQGVLDHPFGRELRVLWEFAGRLEQLRGRSDGPARPDYNFHVADGRVTITERRRGSPIDKLVSELMIYVNSEWGGLLAQNGIAAMYRVQSNGKVRMSTVPAPHQGLGVTQYAWASSPLRRYSDLVNQRQLIAVLRGEEAPYRKNGEDLLGAMRDFELAYDAYAEFQRGMERYWCLRWLLQENVSASGAEVIKENLVRLDHLPLVVRVPSLPETEAGARVEVAVAQIDLLELTCQCRFLRPLAG